MDINHSAIFQSVCKRYHQKSVIDSV